MRLQVGLWRPAASLHDIHRFCGKNCRETPIYSVKSLTFLWILFTIELSHCDYISGLHRATRCVAFFFALFQNFNRLIAIFIYI